MKITDILARFERFLGTELSQKVPQCHCRQVSGTFLVVGPCLAFLFCVSLPIATARGLGVSGTDTEAISALAKLMQEPAFQPHRHRSCKALDQVVALSHKRHLEEEQFLEAPIQIIQCWHPL